MEHPASKQVTVIVVSFNTKDKLRTCLQAIGPDFPTIVVDNASHDGSAEMVKLEFPLVRLIASDENVGFGAGNNLGLKEVETDYALLLNSDAYADPASIDRLVQAMEPGVVACGGRLLNPDRSLQESACNELTLWAVFCEQFLLEKAFKKSRMFNNYWISSRYSSTHEVEQVMGACLLMRPIEKFDERFFLYCEDTELCKRLRTHGRILYVPEATFVHELGSSSSSMRWRSIAFYNRGKEMYFRIHQGRLAQYFAWSCDRKGALLRTLIFLIPSVVSSSSRAKVLMFWKVLTAPFNGPRR